jgi:hypothetical protein
MKEKATLQIVCMFDYFFFKILFSDYLNLELWINFLIVMIYEK